MRSNVKREAKLSELFDMQMGKTPDRNNPEYWQNGTHPWISIADMTSNGKFIEHTKESITQKAVDETGIKPIYPGTVIMSFKLSVGKVARTTTKCYSNEAIMAFEIPEVSVGEPMLTNEYAYYLLQSLNFDNVGNKAVMGKTLNKAILRDTVVKYHTDFRKQSDIVSVLDKVSALIDIRKQQLSKLDELVKARFVEMFGDINTNDKGWDGQPLGELCTIVRGGSPRPIENYLGGDIPWIKIGDATKGDNVYLHSTKEHIIQDGVKRSRMVKSGSLIFANCGVSLGFARIITFDGCIHDGWLAMEDIDERLDKVFLLQALNQMTEHFRKIAPAGTQPNLNTSIMKAYVQIIPPIELQKEYIAFVEQVDKSKFAVQQSLDKLETLKKSLMQKYFG